MGPQRESVKNTDPRTVDILEAAVALAECAAQLENQPCKAAMDTAALMLLNQIEAHCRESMDFLLKGLGNAAEGGDVQFDRVWTLHVMARRSDGMKACITQSGGDTAVLAAMAATPQHGRLMSEGSWLIYKLHSLTGIEAMLKHPSSAVQAAGAWVVYDLAGNKNSDWPGEEATSTGLISLLLGVLLCGSASVQSLHACCCALSRLVYLRPDLSNLLVAHGGAEAVVAAIRCAHAATQRGGPEAVAGGELLGSGAKLIATIAEGNGPAAQQLRQLGAVPALLGTSIPTECATDVIWALGQLGGACAVVEAIQTSSSSPSSINGLSVLAELLWEDNYAEESQSTLAQVAPAVLAIAQTCQSPGVPVADFALAVKSLGGILHRLAPNISPGGWGVADTAVAVLVEAINHEQPVAQEAVESIGKIALIAPSWRGPLEVCLGVICQRIRSPAQSGDRGRLKKYLFWAMAAIAGLPAVIVEMRSQQQMYSVQDAAICAIIDIFDDNLDGEFCLKGTDEAGANPEVRTGQVLDAMRSIVEAMRLHLSCLPVQYRGAHALGILFGLLPEGSDLPREIMEVVLAAWWRNPTNLHVGCGVINAIRSFLAPTRGHNSAAVATALSILRAQDVGPSLKYSLENLPDSRGGPSEMAETAEILEGAAYILGILDGPEAVLAILTKDCTSYSPSIIAAGLKALCELARSFPELFPAATAAKAVADSEALGHASASTDVHRHAELLHGLMRAIVAPMPAIS